MFDLINGLPIHPLVVHGVVVLLPLAILGTIAIAARPAWRADLRPPRRGVCRGRHGAPARRDVERRVPREARG